MCAFGLVQLRGSLLVKVEVPTRVLSPPSIPFKTLKPLNFLNL
jgi:hypothetical protein